MPTDPPRRRVRLRLDVDGDDLDAVAERVHELLAIIAEREGHHMHRARVKTLHVHGNEMVYMIDVDPAVPAGPDYLAALRKWLMDRERDDRIRRSQTRGGTL